MPRCSLSSIAITLVLSAAALTSPGLAMAQETETLETETLETETLETGKQDRLADPFQEILEQAVLALDESYEGWQRRDEEAVDSTSFTINYAASISPNGKRRLDRVLILHADQNGDRRITRSEARRFLEMQLGLRWITGDLLREADGTVVRFAKFLRLDTNQDDQLEASEFERDHLDWADNELEFKKMDRDRDLSLSLAEFAASEKNRSNPIATFRRADKNKNRKLDRKELAASTPKYREHLVASNLAAFDEDDDKQLDLQEYRLSMLGNFNYPWESLPKDKDGDDAISFEEFEFHERGLFHLQRRYYFHRLDRDENQELSIHEFQFARQKFVSLMRVSSDGEDSRELFRDPKFPLCGSPAVSPDEKWILFDATPPEGLNESVIIRMTADGKDSRSLCNGLMPTWSKEGTQFACSRYEGGSGVWIMNLDGTAEKRIDDGWGAQWSPDGKSIAYTNDNNLRVYDVATGKVRTVLGKGEHPYDYLYWNMCWSPDSEQVVFRGKLSDREEIALVQTSGPPKLVRRLQGNKNEFGNDFAWSSDGRRILLNFHANHRRQICQISPGGQDPPKIVPEASFITDARTVCLSPSGQWMVIASAKEGR